MSFTKFLVIPLFIAFQAFVMMLLGKFNLGCKSIIFSGYGAITWISFQAWAMYFLAGCTIKNAVKVFLGYLGGIIAAIAIFELGDLMTGWLNGNSYWGYAIAVFIVVIFVISSEKVPLINFIPAWFIGAGVFFGMMQGYIKTEIASPHTFNHYMAIARPELIACVIGLVYGWITVTFRTYYEKKVSP